MDFLFIMLLGAILLYIIIYIISKGYQIRFEKDFKRIIYSRLKLRPSNIGNYEREISQFLENAMIEYKKEIINEYKDSFTDNLLDSKDYSKFCSGVFNDLNQSPDDKGIFLLNLNALINENSGYFSTLRHDSDLFNFITEQFREVMIAKFDDSHDFKDEFYYEENKQSGVAIRWHDDGTIEEKITFEKGLKIKIESWYSNGKKREEGEIKNNDWYNYHRLWNMDGQIIEELITDKNQQITRWSHWFSNGQLSWENNYKDNLNHGINSSYQETGELWNFESWLEDKRHGECRYHYSEFPYKIKAIVNYKHGLKHGKYKSFNSKGELFYETNFIKGTGVAKDCDKNYGVLEYVHRYENGKIVHEQVLYNNGKLEMETFWRNDKIISEIFWDENGNQKKER